MSLIATQRGEVVLHRVNETAVVVYNPASKSIVHRRVSVTDTGIDPSVCPHCGQSIEHNITPSGDYFKFLRRIQQSESGSAIVDEVVQEDDEPEELNPVDEVLKELDNLPDGISRLSLSQGYFDRFFTTLKLLGRGSRATVYLVEHVLENVSIGKFALKKIPVGYDHKWLEKVLFEVNLLGLLAHPNLVRYNHVWLEISIASRFTPPTPYAYMLQEYCDGGTLEDYVFSRREGHRSPQLSAKEERQRRKQGLRVVPEVEIPGGELSLEEIKSFMIDIVSGIAHLHDQGFLHCDLKPSNCLLQLHENGHLPTVLVSDFGESQRDGSARVGTGATGTLEYTAPEALTSINGKYPPFTKHSDMFSVGMTLHFLAFSSLPYSDTWKSEGDLQRLKEEVLDFSFDFSSSVRGSGRTDLEPIRPLLTSLLGSPEERPNAVEVLEMLRELPTGPAGASVPLSTSPIASLSEKTVVAISRPVSKAPFRDIEDSEPPPKKRRTDPRVPNILRALKVVSLYAARPSGWVLHGCAALGVAELFINRPEEFFAAHCLLLLVGVLNQN